MNLADNPEFESTITKSRVFAHILVNSGIERDLDHAQFRVRQRFEEEFPEATFEEWDRPVRGEEAAAIVRAVGRVSSIDPRHFMQELGTVKGMAND
jgi:hypothetical protein